MRNRTDLKGFQEESVKNGTRQGEEGGDVICDRLCTIIQAMGGSHVLFATAQLYQPINRRFAIVQVLGVQFESLHSEVKTIS